MKKYCILLLSLVVFSCDNSDDSLDFIAAVESELGVTATNSPLGGEGHFFQSVAYGTAERQEFDILLPEGEQFKGVLLFFHGGGFTSGDKSNAFDDYLVETMQTVLDNDIAIVSANYTLLSTVGNEGVLSALEDGEAALNFLRSKLSLLNIPTDKMVIAGVSAGAGIAQWNGFQAPNNAQLQGVLAIAAQSSYDLYQWENVFPGFSLDALRQLIPFLQALYLQFYNGEPTPEALATLDYRALMDASDPPLYVYNTAGDEVINAQGELDFDVLYHSYRHADYLRQQAIEVGQAFSGAFQESPEEFVLRVLE